MAVIHACSGLTDADHALDYIVGIAIALATFGICQVELVDKPSCSGPFLSEFYVPGTDQALFRIQIYWRPVPGT